MKRIGIVLTHLDPDRTGGAETYSRAMVRQFDRMDSPYHFVLFVGRDHRLTITADHMELVECDVDPRRRKRRIIWEQTRLASILRRHQLDLTHFPYGAPPVTYAGPYVATIHDTKRLQMPRELPNIERMYRTMVESAIVRRGAAVIGVTRVDTDAFCRLTGLPTSRAFVVPHGIEEELIVKEPLPAEDREHELLWVGRAYGTKNLDFLLKVFARLCPQVRRPPTLRLVGIEPAHEKPLRAAAERLGVLDRVRMDRPMSHEQVTQVLRGALLLCYPSTYESFGLPVLESMAAGTPVVCSDIPPFRELYADAAVICDLHDVEKWVSTIRRFLDDRAAYDQAAADGLTLARQYTWHVTTEKTLAVYRQLLEDTFDTKRRDLSR